jgi:hypothetical protein
MAKYNHVPTIFNHMPSAQEVFDAACVHLAAQKRPAKTLGGGCYYRNNEGCACAVGHFIPDDKYDPNMEGGLYTLVEKFHKQLPAWFGHHRNLLSDLQNAHDHALGVESLQRRLNDVAEEHHLDTAKIALITVFNVLPQS